MTPTARQQRLTTGFFLLSLLVHLLFLLIPESTFLPAIDPPEPVYVEMRPPQQRERELDLASRPELEKPRETPAQRLGPTDQVVEREQAPEGDATEDRPPVSATPPAPPTPPVTATTPPRREPPPAAPPVRSEPPRPVSPGGERPVTESVAPAPLEQPLPDLQQLTRISPGALARIESDWRQKYRDNLQQGDTVWLDTEQDLLFSFMRRFRDNIYLVWNYPAAAAQLGQEGTCLLRITVDRQGNVDEVRLLESSGSPSLDNEAIRAVKLGASYGPLPQAYPNDKLHIMAFFQYSLERTGYRRPVRVY
ncbi:MAG: energy transducer TonB [Desulfuromonadales bacterium]|nr:energy transducer TonB [Desulfuromonadales bacterium]